MIFSEPLVPLFGVEMWLQILLFVCCATCIIIMSPPPAKRPRKVLSLETKRELLRLCDEGWSNARIQEYFGLAKSSLCEMKKAREKIMAYTDEFSAASKTGKKKERKIMAKPKNIELDQCVIKWYHQQRASGITVRGTDLKIAAERFASNIGLQGFKGSEGWLFRFKLRHGLSNGKAYGESLDVNDINQDWKEINDLIKKEGILLEQLYNIDETGLYYRSIPENTLVSEKEKSVLRELCKSRVSLLFGANAIGSHRLKPVVLGKAKQPWCLHGLLDSLPVHYEYSSNAWFTGRVFKKWFFQHAVPEIVRYQVDVMRMSRDRVRALILLDNAPVHPSSSELVAENGRIRVKFLPSNITSLIQPMDQGIVVTFKRLYRRRFLEEVMVVVDEEDGNMGQLTLENLKKYNIRSVIHNIAHAWNDVPSSMLAGGWNRLLHGTEPVIDFEGFEAADFHCHFLQTGGNATVEDVKDWLECDEGDPGQQVLTEEQITAEVLYPDEGNGSEDDDPVASRPKTWQARKATDVLLEYMEHPISSPHMQCYGPVLREIRDALIKAQSRWSMKPTNIETFFKPTSPSHPSPSPMSPCSPSSRPDSLSPDDVSLPGLPLSPCSSETPRPFQITGEDSLAEIEWTDSGDEKKEEQEIMVPKRKRGRPRKSEQKQTQSESRAYPRDEPEYHDEALERKVRPVRKKKGTFITGPDYVSAYGDSDDNSVTGEDSPAEIEWTDSGDGKKEEQKVMVPKRKRGRPRKYEQKQTQSESGAHPTYIPKDYGEVYVDMAEDPEGYLKETCSSGDSEMSPRVSSEIKELKQGGNEEFVSQEWDVFDLDRVKKENQPENIITLVEVKCEVEDEEMVHIKEEK